MASSILQPLCKNPSADNIIQMCIYIFTCKSSLQDFLVAQPMGVGLRCEDHVNGMNEFFVKKNSLYSCVFW